MNDAETSALVLRLFLVKTCSPCFMSLSDYESTSIYVVIVPCSVFHVLKRHRIRKQEESVETKEVDDAYKGTLILCL